jgi:hypothetical protein
MKIPQLASPVIWMTACVAIVISASLSAAEGVVSPAKRVETIAQGKGLLADKTVLFNGKNIFNPDGFGEGIADTGSSGNVSNPIPTGPRSPRELLQAIGASLKPSGFFVLGGEPTLVFGQKRVKAGESMTITFEGAEYTVEIISIDRPNFTLRLNREEFTRPIK